MRRDSASKLGRSLLGLAALIVVVGLAPSKALAQIPEPRVPDINQRSGLLQRFNMPKTTLPHDPYRDTFWGTRPGDHRKVADKNTFWDGGLFGVRLPAKDTASVYPFFYGAPGQSTITADSKSWRPAILRPVQQLLHQRKPVGMYYDRGSYVPIYDLDSFAPGPGPDLFPFFYQGFHGG